MENHVQGIINDLAQKKADFDMSLNPLNEITGEMLLSRNVQEIPSLLDPLLPKAGLACLAGSSDTGKSAFLRQFSMCVAAGVDSFRVVKVRIFYK